MLEHSGIYNTDNVNVKKLSVFVNEFVIRKRQCCRVKKSEMVKCPGVIGWKANARPTGMDCVGKCPAIARGGGGGGEMGTAGID